MTEPVSASEIEPVADNPGKRIAGRDRAQRRSTAHALIDRFFEAYNAQDRDALVGLVSDQVVLDCHPQRREWGRDSLDALLSKCQSEFREHVFDIEIMTNTDGTRAAAEYTVLGVPIGSEATDLEETPQSYRFNGGLFFEIKDARIERLSPLRNVPRVAESLV